MFFLHRVEQKLLNHSPMGNFKQWSVKTDWSHRATKLLSLLERLHTHASWLHLLFVRGGHTRCYDRSGRLVRLQSRQKLLGLFQCSNKEKSRPARSSGSLYLVGHVLFFIIRPLKKLFFPTLSTWPGKHAWGWNHRLRHAAPQDAGK